MKIIIAPDKFKGSLTAKEAAAAIRTGLREKIPSVEAILLPMADGGNGTAEILAEISNGRMVKCWVKDPLFRDIECSYGLSGDGSTAFIEMAAASGLELLSKKEQNCYHTSSYGTGELIRAAAGKNVRRIILCIGGSATNDGGIGMAAALGYRFLDENNYPLGPVGKNLEFIHSIDDSSVPSILKNINFEIACDVNNPLTGPSGAAYTYGPQKGASAEELQKLDNGLENLAFRLQEKYNIDIRNVPGSGAAGGMGGGAMVFLASILKSGIEIVLDYLQFEEHLKTAKFIITGEGKLDKQSLSGKVIHGILRKAAIFNVPVIALAGILELTDQEIIKSGLYKAYCINPAGRPLDECLRNANASLRNTSGKLAHELFSNE